MNFKPNLLKIIISLIAGISIHYIFPSLKYAFGLNNSPWILLINLISFLVVYLIWSLLQKKK